MIPAVGTPQRAAWLRDNAARAARSAERDRVAAEDARRREEEREAIKAALARRDAEGQAAIRAAAKRHPMARIVAEVAAQHGVPVADMMKRTPAKRGKGNRLTHIRQEAMWRIKRDLNLSLSEIGRRFGGLDHSTVIHGVRAHAARLAAEGGRG